MPLQSKTGLLAWSASCRNLAQKHGCRTAKYGIAAVDGIPKLVEKTDFQARLPVYRKAIVCGN